MDSVSESIGRALDAYNTYVGQYALMILLVPVGVMFTVWLGGIQVRRLGHAVAIARGKFDDPNDPGDISHFQALCAALSATIYHKATMQFFERAMTSVTTAAAAERERPERAEKEPKGKASKSSKGK